MHFLKSWKKSFHIATIKWLIVLIPDCLSNIYLLEVEIYSDHWMKKTLNKYWSINRNVFYFIVLQFYFYTIKIKYNMQHRICKFEAKLLLNRFIYSIL